LAQFRQRFDRIASMVGDDRALQLADRRVERPQLRKQNPQRRLDDRRKVGGGSRRLAIIMHAMLRDGTEFAPA
jgi:hypothetical protein